MTYHLWVESFSLLFGFKNRGKQSNRTLQGQKGSSHYETVWGISPKIFSIPNAHNCELREKTKKKPFQLCGGVPFMTLINEYSTSTLCAPDGMKCPASSTEINTFYPK